MPGGLKGSGLQIGQTTRICRLVSICIYVDTNMFGNSIQRVKRPKGACFICLLTTVFEVKTEHKLL